MGSAGPVHKIGSVVTFTLTNNGPSRLIGRYDLAGTGRHSCCNIGYTDANSASTLISSSTTWGDPHVRQYYGSKLWGKIDFSITAVGNTEITYLNFGPCANGANQSSVMQTIIDATTRREHSGILTQMLVKVSVWE